jgi:hypothetical protein
VALQRGRRIERGKREPRSGRIKGRVWPCGPSVREVDALDDCEDEAVKDWYNKSIRRDQGGLDRTINKWMGRKERVPGDR